MNMSIRGLVFLLATLIVLLVGLSLFAGFEASKSSAIAPASASPSNVVLPPPLTPAVQAQLAASHGFQYLVSYTGRGFEPAKLTIKKGETIRFTNNSSEDLWVAATGASGAVYPAGASTECGQSAFDSCKVLKSGEFWEFTFTTAGTWSYKNNSDTKMTGIITVK